jgi:hypothetical protein
VFPDPGALLAHEGPQDMILDLTTGSLDLAVLYSPQHLPDMHYEQVAEESFVMVSTRGVTFGEAAPAGYVRANYSAFFNRTHKQMPPELENVPVSTRKWWCRRLPPAKPWRHRLRHRNGGDEIAAGRRGGLCCRCAEDLASHLFGRACQAPSLPHACSPAQGAQTDDRVESEEVDRDVSRWRAATGEDEAVLTAKNVQAIAS